MEDNTPKLPLGTIVLLTYKGSGNIEGYNTWHLTTPLSTKQIYDSITNIINEGKYIITNIKYIYPPKQ